MNDESLRIAGCKWENYYLKEKLGKENAVLEHELEKDQGPRLGSE